MFPNSNLPTASQQWGKEVVKRIEATEVTVARNETNNLTRDTQLNSAMLAANAAINGLKAADTEILAVALQAGQAADAANAAATLAQGAADDALEALGAIGALEDNIYVAGTTEINGTTIKTGTFAADKITTGALNASLITVGTLTADRISGGTLNGGVVQITNINASNITTGTLTADKISGGTLNGGVVTITNLNASNITTGFLSATRIAAGELVGFTIKTSNDPTRTVVDGASNALQFWTGGSLGGTITGASTTYGPSISVNGVLYAGISSFTTVHASGLIDGGSGLFGTLDCFTDMTAGGNFDLTGNLDCSGTAIIRSAATTTGITNTGGISSTGTISTNGGLVRTVYAGGGTTGASFDNNGTVIRTTSSARYKQDISELSFNYEDLLSLEPKKFRLKSEVAEDANAREYAGFIAEEIAGTSLDIFVSYQPTEDGGKRPDGVYYGELTAALLYALKQQDAAIKALSGRIEVLENN